MLLTRKGNALPQNTRSTHVNWKIKKWNHPWRETIKGKLESGRIWLKWNTWRRRGRLIKVLHSLPYLQSCCLWIWWIVLSLEAVTRSWRRNQKDNLELELVLKSSSSRWKLSPSDWKNSLYERYRYRWGRIRRTDEYLDAWIP